jgi:hypothetical protein
MDPDEVESKERRKLWHSTRGTEEFKQVLSTIYTQSDLFLVQGRWKRTQWIKCTKSKRINGKFGSSLG